MPGTSEQANSVTSPRTPICQLFMPKQDHSLNTNQFAEGVVHAVRGAVVDVIFSGTDLPPINSALVVEWDRSTPGCRRRSERQRTCAT
jgi:hypothetical protein